MRSLILEHSSAKTLMLHNASTMAKESSSLLYAMASVTARKANADMRRYVNQHSGCGDI